MLCASVDAPAAPKHPARGAERRLMRYIAERCNEQRDGIYGDNEVL